MTLKKMTTYMDEDLLREAKVYAAQSDVKIYEVIDVALRRYLKEADGDGDRERQPQQPRPRVPLLPGGEDPTLGGRFEEELYRP